MLTYADPFRDKKEVDSAASLGYIRSMDGGIDPKPNWRKIMSNRDLRYTVSGYTTGSVQRASLVVGDTVVGNFNANANGGTRGVYDYELVLKWDDDECQELVATLIPAFEKLPDVKETIQKMLGAGRIRAA